VNAPLRRVAISVLVLFTMLIINVNYIQVVRSDELRNAPGNTRVLAEEYDRERGSIIVGGDPIAMSVATDDRLTYLRQYPQGELYAGITGYYSLVYGNTGMERAENPVLAGSDPRLFVRRLADLFTGRDPAGGDVVLTLDPAVQKAAMAGLQGKTGAVVALDPSTGAILGMASTPTFDPNKLSSHEPRKIRDYAAQLDKASPDPRVNQATRERYPPGSIFKVIVSAAALQNGYTPESMLKAPNELDLPGTSATIKNFGGSSCNGGDQSLIDALTVSCNTAFAQLGMDLGVDKVRAMAEAFGMDGEGFEIPLSVTGSTVGNIDSKAALAQSSIGQRDVAATPLQAAMIAATVANHGKLMKPYLVDQMRAPDLTVIDRTDPEEFKKPISPEIADQLTTMMESVVENGSGKAAKLPGVKVAGKTGTAQVGEGVPDHNWFIGFAPADDPKIAVAVFVKNGGGTGGGIAAPIAHDVLQAYLDGHGG
jgi:peptidoglycan glycosyltransferase